MLSNRQMKIVRVRNMGDVAKQAVEFGFRLLKLAVLLEIDAWQRPRQGTWRQEEPPAHGIDGRASASQVDVFTSLPACVVGAV